MTVRLKIPWLSSVLQNGVQAHIITAIASFKLFTGFFAGIFAIIGLFRYWGSDQWGWFLALVLVSAYFTELVKQQVGSQGVYGANRLLVFCAFARQVAVIIRGIQSFWI